MNLKYSIGAVVAFPLLPIMYMQGKKIRKEVPQLPEAKGTEGQAGENNSRKLRLLAIGESTIAGVGVDTHEEGFTGTLAKEISSALDIQVNWHVYARSGYTAKNVRKKIIPKIDQKAADLIVVGLGGNDSFTLNTPKKWQQDVDKLIGEIRFKFPDSPIVFSNMPPIKIFPAFTPLIKWVVGNLSEILGESLAEVVQKHSNVFYSGRKITVEGWIKRFNVDAHPDDFFSDGVHPFKNHLPGLGQRHGQLYNL